MAVPNRNWLVGNNSSKMGSGSSEYEEELARRLWRVSGEPDGGLDAERN